MILKAILCYFCVCGVVTIDTEISFTKQYMRIYVTLCIRHQFYFRVMQHQLMESEMSTGIPVLIINIEFHSFQHLLLSSAGHDVTLDIKSLEKERPGHLDYLSSRSTTYMFSKIVVYLLS